MNYTVLKEVNIDGTKGVKFNKNIKNFYAMFDETLKAFTNNVFKNKGPEYDDKDYDIMDVYDKMTC